MLPVYRYEEFAFDPGARNPRSSSTELEAIRDIVEQVRIRGDAAVREFSARFDDAAPDPFEEFCRPDDISGDLRVALRIAAENIERFHQAQMPAPLEIETAPGVICRREWRPIDTIGLYIPGGSAPLVSTVLMLGIPARLAGCRIRVLCTPPPVANEILYAAQLAGIERVFRIGGAQAIAAMAFGTETVPQADKIFGPGSRFVASAKAIVAGPPYFRPIDLHAGPSELIVIADDSANPEWIAADLLTQAEHGPDSGVVLVTNSDKLLDAVQQQLKKQLPQLPRSETIQIAFTNSFILKTSTLKDGIEFANRYAPEHLLLAVRDAQQWVRQIRNAGSVFLGENSSVVFGDYASGTNHTLPTGGSARAMGGITIESFLKPISFQRITERGLAQIAKAAETIAEAEGLVAHARAASMRLPRATLPDMSNYDRMLPIRPHLQRIKPYSSARSEAESGEVFLDANEFTGGSPVSLNSLKLNRYPDPFQSKLRTRIAEQNEVSPDCVFVGSGSDEIIDLIVRLIQDPVAILEPTYGVYRVAAEIQGANVIGIPLNEDFQIDLPKTLKRSAPASVLFCCSPNNPTGNLLRSEDILQLCKEFKGIVVVDEAYIEFSDSASLVCRIGNNKNLMILRTFSKARGLAGIRAGYCFASPEIVSYLLRIKAPYNLNAVSAAFALKAIEDSGWMDRAVAAVRQERSRLAVELSSCRHVRKIYPSDANFLLVAFENSEEVYRALKDRGLIVRRRTESELRNCLRITVGTPEENDRLLAVLQGDLR